MVYNAGIKKEKTRTHWHQALFWMVPKVFKFLNLITRFFQKIK